MTQVNLLPQDVRQRQRTRRMTLAVAAGATGVVALLLFVFLLQVGRLATAKHDLARQESVNAGISTQISGLQRFATLKQTVSDRVGLETDVLRSQVLWSGVLRDVSMVIPGQMWLTSMTGTASDVFQTSVAPTGDEVLVGTISFSGVAFDHPTVAKWLTRLEQVDGWVNSWISTASKSDMNGTTVVTFNGTVDINTSGTVDGRQRR
jgi:Tfp pilus assembly protein PilN